MVRWGKLSCGAATKLKKKSPKSANVVLFSYDEDDVELGVSAKEKGKIDSKVGTTNTIKINHEKVSYVDITIWQIIHYHFSTFQDDHLQYVRDFIISEAKRPLLKERKNA